MLYKGTANRPSFTLLKASPVRPGARKAYLVVETTNEPDDEVAIGTPPVLRVVTYPKTKKGLKMAEKEFVRAIQDGLPKKLSKREIEEALCDAVFRQGGWTISLCSSEG